MDTVDMSGGHEFVPGRGDGLCMWSKNPRWHCAKAREDIVHVPFIASRNKENKMATPYGGDHIPHLSYRPDSGREMSPDATEGIASILRGDPPPPPSAPQVASDFFMGCVELARSKDRAYGGAWRRQGYMGNLARILSKAARLENVAWSDNPDLGEKGILAETEESLEDTLKDLANMASFMYHNMRDGNRWGDR